jgi:glycosyltransferase involved in cell wall biosynthesis
MNKKNIDKKKSICLITYIHNKAFIPPVSQLEEILYSVSDKIYGIEGNLDNLSTNNEDKIHKFKIIHKQEKYLLLRVLRIFYLQMQMSFKLVQLSKNINSCIFFTGQWEFLPILTAKLLRKKTIWLLPSFYPLIEQYNNNRTFLDKYYIYIMKLSMYLCDKLIIYSPKLVKEWGLEKYQRKISFAHHHLVDLNKYAIEKKIEEREVTVGYFGRLSHEKGIINFIKSIDQLSKDMKVNFIIIGTGDLKDSIIEYINKNKLNNVKIMGWVDDSEIPKYLNEFKLIVLPSYTEGLPNTMLESIACGTPVLGNSVGAIPDILIDGETGFIMDDNDPATIKDNLVRALQYPAIDKIVDNAYDLVKNEFNLETTVKKWENILEYYD